MKVRWTPELLDKVLALKASGLTWDTIADRIGAPSQSMQTMAGWHRRGMLKFTRHHNEIRNEEMERLFLEGWGIRKLGERFGITHQAVAMVLRRRGVDREVRDEFRRLDANRDRTEGPLRLTG